MKYISERDEVEKKTNMMTEEADRKSPRLERSWTNDIVITDHST